MDTQAPARSTPFLPNGYDLYSVTGNVWEWCADWFQSSVFFGHNAERSDRPCGWTKQSDERRLFSLSCIVLQPLSCRSANCQHAR